MAVQSLKLTVVATPSLLRAAHQRGLSDTVWVEVYNPGPTTIYLGPSNVTTTDGRPVAAGQSWSFPLGDGDALYARTASGSQDVIVFSGRQ